MSRKNRGFTLIEILVAITIMGILASVVLVGLGGTKEKARDSARTTHLLQLQTMLDMYEMKETNYPTSTEDFQIQDHPWGSLWEEYGQTPKDPLPAQNYAYVSDGLSYQIYAKFEKEPVNPFFACDAPCGPNGEYNGGLSSPGSALIALIPLKDNGQSCSSGSECSSGFCVDGVCCSTACTGSVCQRCDSYSSAGAGTCGYVSSSSQDPNNECGTSGCFTGNCKGDGYACGYYTSGLGNCTVTCTGCQGATSGSCVTYTNYAEGYGCTEACKGCSSGSCVNIPNNTQDTIGSNLCNATCVKCSNGSCVNQSSSEDLFSQCPDSGCSTGNCSGTGASCDVLVSTDSSGTIDGDIVYCDAHNRLWTPTAVIGGTATKYVWGPTGQRVYSCIGKGSSYPACHYCDTLTYAGYSDWELPSCVSGTKNSNCILWQFGADACSSWYPCTPAWDANAQGYYYWSSSDAHSNLAYLVSFFGGSVSSPGKIYAYYARCVRGQ